MSKGDSLKLAKRRLSERYLGVAGIYGLGLMRAGHVLRVYCTPGDSAKRRAVFKRLKRDSEQFTLEIVAKLPPRAG